MGDVRPGKISFTSRATYPGAYLERVGAAGALPAVKSDSVNLTTQNVAANKTDYFLHRTISYHVALAPVGGDSSGVPTQAVASATYDLSLRNAAPAAGLPSIIIGPYELGFRAGENATYLSIYSPLSFVDATLDGVHTTLSSATDDGNNVYSAFVDLASGQTANLDLSLSGRVPLLPGGWYELELPHQPVVNPDQVAVTVVLAPGWKVVAVRGARVTGARQVGVHLTQTADQAVWVQLAPDPGAGP